MNPFLFHYSNDNKKNAFNNDGNNEHGLKNVTRKQTLVRGGQLISDWCSLKRFSIREESYDIL